MGVVYLVRHGQASFGSEDYDRLSDLGERQAHYVGISLAAAGLKHVAVVSGSLRRQVRTAQVIVDSAGWPAAPTVDDSWNEFDHFGLAQGTGSSAAWQDSRTFQEQLEVGMRDWYDGRARSIETFAQFRHRTEDALESVLTRLATGGSVLVVSSGGVISWLATSLLAGGVEQWLRLNRVSINGGITMIVVSARGRSLVSFNSQGHIPHSDVTYR